MNQYIVMREDGSDLELIYAGSAKQAAEEYTTYGHLFDEISEVILVLPVSSMFRFRTDPETRIDWNVKPDTKESEVA